MKQIASEITQPSGFPLLLVLPIQLEDISSCTNIFLSKLPIQFHERTPQDIAAFQQGHSLLSLRLEFLLFFLSMIFILKIRRKNCSLTHNVA